MSARGRIEFIQDSPTPDTPPHQRETVLLSARLVNVEELIPIVQKHELRIQALEQSNALLDAENAQLKVKIIELGQQIAELKGMVTVVSSNHQPIVVQQTEPIATTLIPLHVQQSHELGMLQGKVSSMETQMSASQQMQAPILAQLASIQSGVNQIQAQTLLNQQLLKFVVQRINDNSTEIQKLLSEHQKDLRLCYNDFLMNQQNSTTAILTYITQAVQYQTAMQAEQHQELGDFLITQAQALHFKFAEFKEMRFEDSKKLDEFINHLVREMIECQQGIHFLFQTLSAQQLQFQGNYEIVQRKQQEMGQQIVDACNYFYYQYIYLQNAFGKFLQLPYYAQIYNDMKQNLSQLVLSFQNFGIDFTPEHKLALEYHPST